MQVSSHLVGEKPEVDGLEHYVEIEVCFRDSLHQSQNQNLASSIPFEARAATNPILPAPSPFLPTFLHFDIFLSDH